MKKIFVLFLMLLCVLMANATTVSLSATTTGITPVQLDGGQTTTAYVYLTGAKNFCGMEADLFLPEGVSITKKANSDLSKDEEGENIHTCQFSNRGVNGWKILIYSSELINFTADEGAVMKLTLTADAGFKGGYAQFKGIIFADPITYVNDSKEFYIGSSSVPATSISLDKPSVTLTKGTTTTLTATVLPSNASNKTVTWKSSNSSIASVDNGVVTAVGAGTATITATTTDGTGLSATCTVTVTGGSGQADTDISKYSNIIYTINETVRPGSTFPINIKMKNAESIIGFQFDLKLPKGMTFAYNTEEEDYDINLSTERTTLKRHSLSYLTQEDGSMRIVCTSNNNYAFNYNDGLVLTVMVNVAKNLNPGDYALYLNNIEMTTSALKSINVDQCKSTLTVKTYTLGDVNNDGNITVTDAACVVAFILGSNIDGLIREAADVNQDGNISVTDAACVVDIILHGGTSAAKPEPMPKATDDTTANKLFVEDFSAKPGDQVVIPVMMDNDAEITAFQFDMYLPNGITIAEEDGEPLIDLSQSRTTYKKHSLSYLQQENGAMRIVCNSGTNKTFSGNSGEVVNVTVNIPETMAEGEYEISIKAQELTTSALQSINVDETKCKLTIETPTGITSIRNASTTDAPAYNLQGIRVNSGYKGIVIKEGKKFLK